jgi:hypothetical protein
MQDYIFLSETPLQAGNHSARVGIGLGWAVFMSLVSADDFNVRYSKR